MSYLGSNVILEIAEGLRLNEPECTWYFGFNSPLNDSFFLDYIPRLSLSKYFLLSAGVHFFYPLRPNVKILSGLNLVLKCGTVTALVGPSGAGKSTIIQLSARFYEPTSGRITVAGEDLRTFDKSEWARVSIVNQVIC